MRMHISGFSPGCHRVKIRLKVRVRGMPPMCLPRSEGHSPSRAHTLALLGPASLRVNFGVRGRIRGRISKLGLGLKVGLEAGLEVGLGSGVGVEVGLEVGIVIGVRVRVWVGVRVRAGLGLGLGAFPLTLSRPCFTLPASAAAWPRVG